MIIEEELILYYHDCKKYPCPVIKGNKEPCRFCGTKKFKKRKVKITRHEFPLIEEYEK